MLGFHVRNTGSANPGPRVSAVAADPSEGKATVRQVGALERTAPPEANTPAMPRRLGSMLVEEHLVAQEHVEEALAFQREHGGFLGQILVEKGYLKQNELMLCLVKQCRIPHISLLDYDISKDVLQLVPQDLCRIHNLIPIDKLGRILTVAMVNPLDTAALDEVKKICPELRIKPILCDWQHLKTVFTRTFGSSKTDLDESDLLLGPKRQMPKPAASASPEILAQLDAVTEDLIRQAATEPEVVSVDDAAPAVSPAADPEPLDITAIARESVSGALQEAMSTLMVSSRASVHEEKPAPSTEDLSRTIRESVAGAMQEAIALMSVQSRANTPSIQSPNTADLEGMIRESVAAALQEAMATKSITDRALALDTPEPEDGTQDSMRLAVREALRDNETVAVNRTTLRDLERRDAERLKRQKHASVSAFAPTRRMVDGMEARLESDERVLAALNSDHLLPEFTFDSFVVGKGNVFTVKVCRAVAAQPGGDYNPFFIHGDVGLGKTHLVNAVGNAIVAANPDARIGYVSSSRFATRLIDALRDGAADAFRANYCHWDVLILDDIQFLGGRVDAQEEFFHIFNVLQQQGRQVIIASDKAPDRLGMLEQRLISRFSGGIVANVRPPEFETRVAILRGQLAAGGAELPDDVIGLVASRVTHDVRKMIGVVRKLLAYTHLLEGQVTCEMANDILIQLGIDEAA